MEYLIYDQQESAHSSTDAEEETPLTAGEIEVVAKRLFVFTMKKEQTSRTSLFGAKRTHNDLIMSILKTRIPIVADGGAASYLQSLEVMIMLDTLRVINNPLNDYALVACLNHLCSDSMKMS